MDRKRTAQYNYNSNYARRNRGWHIMAGLGSLLGGLAANFLFPGAGLLGLAAGAGVGGILEQAFTKEDQGDLDEKMAKWNRGPESTEDALANLFKSRFTDPETGVSPHFDTAEARDAYDRSFMEKYGGQPAVATPYKMAMGGMADSGIGGLIQGPGTVTSDDIPGKIMQNGRPVEDILVANNEVILSGKDLKSITPAGKDWKQTAKRIGDAPNGQRVQTAARVFEEFRRNKG
jgi:hypothetical protein